MKSTLPVLITALLAWPAAAGETPEARSAREKLEPYARAFGIQLVPLKYAPDASLKDSDFQDERDAFYGAQRCFRDGRELDGECRAGNYLTLARFKAAYEEAVGGGAAPDHRKGVRWFCGLVDASRAYFHYYHGSTYHGSAPGGVAFAQAVTDAEAALLKEAYGIDLRVDSRFTLSGCSEELTDEFKKAGLIGKEPGHDQPHGRGDAPGREEPPGQAREPDAVVSGVEDLRRLQGEGNRFVWFSSTLWGTWTKDIDTLALLLGCRGPRWVGSFVGVVPRDSAYTGGALFTGRVVRHRTQPSSFAAIDWAAVRSPERRTACRELSRRLKR